jgi:hypothetical protein
MDQHPMTRGTTMSMTTGSVRTGGQRLLVVGSVLAGLVAVLVGAWALFSTALTPPVPMRVTAAAVPGTEDGAQIAGVNTQAEGVNSGTVAQARGIQMRVEAPGRIPRDRIGSGPTGGCVLGYGRGDACLPTVPPGVQAHAGHGGTLADLSDRWTCARVRHLFAEGIAVNSQSDGLGPDGRDPLGLDTNGDGQACGPGDQA